jgi:hypothetical protein
MRQRVPSPSSSAQPSPTRHRICSECHRIRSASLMNAMAPSTWEAFLARVPHLAHASPSRLPVAQPVVFSPVPPILLTHSNTLRAGPTPRHNPRARPVKTQLCTQKRGAERRGCTRLKSRAHNPPNRGVDAKISEGRVAMDDDTAAGSYMPTSFLRHLSAFEVCQWDTSGG